jgi:hypothetical protein
MSVIIDFLVIAHLPSPHVLEEINSKLYELDEERHQQFRPLDTDQAGGTKAVGTEVWAGAFNHLLPEEVREAILSADWSGFFGPEELDALIIESSGDYEIDLRARTLQELRKAS